MESRALRYAPLMFQSLTGRLQTVIIPADASIQQVFQSLTGRLQTKEDKMYSRFNLVSIPHR